MAKEEVRHTIKTSLAGTGVAFSSEVVERVVRTTRGHPFEMQLLCYHLFQFQLARQVDVEVWDKALQATLSDLGVARFEHWIKDSESEDDMLVLKALSVCDEPLSARDIYRSLRTSSNKVSIRRLQIALRSLSERRVVDQIGNDVYEITDRMFHAYLAAGRF